MFQERFETLDSVSTTCTFFYDDRQSLNSIAAWNFALVIIDADPPQQHDLFYLL